MPFIRRVGRPGLVGLAARTAVVAGTATAVSGGIARNQQRRAEQQYEQEQYEAQQQQAQMQAMAQQAVADQSAPAPSTPAAGGADMMTQLQQLATMHTQGLLSDDEFAAAKTKLLS